MGYMVVSWLGQSRCMELVLVQWYRLGCTSELGNSSRYRRYRQLCLLGMGNHQGQCTLRCCTHNCKYSSNHQSGGSRDPRSMSSMELAQCTRPSCSPVGYTCSRSST